MTFILRSAIVAAALAVLSACASGPLPLAACRLDPAVPRTTAAVQQVASDRGIGGSGISPSDRGLGGSGIRAGIIGVVTGFGSLCVNGFEIAIDDSSSVTVEGRPAKETDIHLGQLVVIEAEASAGKLRAASVDVRLAAVGPISRLSPDGKSISLLGQTVALADYPGAKAGALAPGDWVAVSGLRGADAVIQGTSVLKLPEPGRRAMVAGPLRAQRGAPAVGALELAGAAVPAGAAVVVEGQAVGGQFVVDTVRAEAGARFSAAVRDVSLQTFAPDESLFGLRIAPAELRPALAGRPIQMEGRLIAGETFVPSRAMVPELPRDGASAVRTVIVDRDVILRPFMPADTVRPTLVPPGPR